MEDVLNIILKGDEAAKQRVAQAEEYRREQLASLQSRKEEINKKEIKKAVDEAVKNSEKRKSAGDRQLDELKELYKKAESKMDDLYKENHTKWVNDIVASVTEV